MEVILLERIERLGQMGDVVNVKDGFARNFLLKNLLWPNWKFNTKSLKRFLLNGEIITLGRQRGRLAWTLKNCL